MKKSSIVVIGSSNTDMIIKLERIPRPGETVLGGEFSIAAGGKGANQAVGSARAGGKVALVAKIGADMFGDQAVQGFQRDGIDVACVFRDKKAPSGVALIFVAKDGENSIAVASGANGKLTPADVRKAKPVIAGAGIVILQLETPMETVEAAAALAAKQGATVILNPAPARALEDRLLKLVSILTPNETEAEMLTGIAVKDENGAAQAAAALQARGVPTVIVTLGAKGAWVAAEGESRLAPGFKVTPVDTTAAGDVFNGALAAALAEGLPLFEAARFANAAGALSVTAMGAQPSAPTRKQIDKLLKTK